MSEHPERERAKAMRHGRGHPPRSDRPELLAKFLAYIDSTDIPVIAQFAYQNDVGTDQLYRCSGNTLPSCRTPTGCTREY